ncbi:uncharacterized protein Z518_06079 [Rhinocladiella mackenziei CBS 650.93]|uniref:Uncharacterized protein n=1 Tax=Rhinocladiella mackenziei CBS 650.93 TaxID=1442369 RepID=A0A0D2FSW0_9EURO|nr:uncharacterized protein Z518_06079 [Rhinocladiella mackenziei CBS 650.93]KIX05207.1 hypothetical protein Z518_06079 [Rhinocladiella mackenziei CBS 650.93]
MSAPAGPLLNGILPSPVPSVNEAAEYEKILRIRDEVFSGSHPRLTVPAHAIRVPSSQTPSAVSPSHLNVPPPFPSSASPNRLAATQSQREEDSTRVPTKANGMSTASSHPASNVSEFDPVLLTKSDDLVRAETQLKRQRLEKALKEQFEQKRLDARRKPAPSEAKPDFDLPAILARVLDAAKSPFSKHDGDASDSFDENSFYSSRAPDSTPERGPPSHSAEDADELPADEPSGPRVVSAVMGSPLRRDPEDESSTNLARLPVSAAGPIAPSHPADAPPMDLDDEEEEGEYSPPEATAQYPPVHSQAMQDSRDPRSRPLRRYSELEDHGKRLVSPSEANMRIVRNQITSPIAPQPSRVSPLAVAKDAPFLQNARPRRSQRIGRPGSPPSPGDSQAGQPRKKRKVEKKKSRRNGGFSPDAFIKEENVSPPPFHDVQPLGSGRLRPMGADRPIVIDDEPVEEVRYMPAPERYVESPSRPLPRPVEQLMPLSEPRAMSRASLRPVRDDDLRRVASMHSLRAAGGPREYADPYYESPTRARATSYARMGSPAITDGSRPSRDVAMEYERPMQEVRVVRTPAPVYRELYDDGEPPYRYAAESMPPPAPLERIVMDRYGRRFREILQPERTSVVPRAMSVRRGDTDPYENYRPARAGSVFVDAVPERAYASDMPPPQLSYHRFAEAPRNSAAPGPATREYLEPGSLPRSSSVQIMERPQRPTMYADERPEFREPVVRMGSVRPTAIRYDEPPPVEMIPRGQSVRPALHEGSVFLDDRMPAVREYVPDEQPRYREVEPDQRYFDSHGREIIPVGGSMEARPREMERY